MTIIYKIYQEECPCCEALPFERYYFHHEEALLFKKTCPHAYIKEIKVFGE